MPSTDCLTEVEAAVNFLSPLNTQEPSIAETENDVDVERIRWQRLTDCQGAARVYIVDRYTDCDDTRHVYPDGGHNDPDDYITRVCAEHAAMLHDYAWFIQNWKE